MCLPLTRHTSDAVSQFSLRKLGFRDTLSHRRSRRDPTGDGLH